MHIAIQSTTPKHDIFKKRTLNRKESASSSHSAQGAFHSRSATIKISVCIIKMAKNPYKSYPLNKQY